MGAEKKSEAPEMRDDAAKITSHKRQQILINLNMNEKSSAPEHTLNCCPSAHKLNTQLLFNDVRFWNGMLSVSS